MGTLPSGTVTFLFTDIEGSTKLAQGYPILVVCLLVFIVWQKSEGSLLLNPGMAQFILIGFFFVQISYWLSLLVPISHSLEILGDSFVYTGILTRLLLGRLPYLERGRPDFRTQ